MFLAARFLAKKNMRGSPDTGWVWCNNAGLHIQMPTGKYHNVERYRNYRLFGTGTVILGCKYQFSNDSTSILIVELLYDPPRVRAINMVSYGDFDWLELDASASHFFAATKKGLEVRDLHNLEIKKIWPGSFGAVVALPNDCAACIDTRTMQVLKLNQNAGRWNSNSFSIDAISSADGFFLRQSHYSEKRDCYWCPKHDHGINIPVNHDLSFCNGTEYFYTGTNMVYYSIFSSHQDLLLWRLRADDLVITDKYVAYMLNNKVIVIPRRFWARRVLFLTRTGLPLNIILKIKEKI